MSDSAKRRVNSRIKVSNRFIPGATADATPGSTLDIVALGFGAGELFGVDLASRAFVRSETQDLAHDLELEGEPVREDVPFPYRVGEVYRLLVGHAQPFDAGRPEAIWVDAPLQRTGHISRHALRRLCSDLKFAERSGALVLGSRVHSRSYADLCPSDPSMVLLELRHRDCQLLAESSGRVVLTVVWGGRKQHIVVNEQRVCAIARAHQGRALQNKDLQRALGIKIGFALIAYGHVKDRYVEKVVVGLVEG